jgi:rubrerythrin
MNFKGIKSIDDLIKQGETLSAVTEVAGDPSEEQILRISISSELSAINLYQELAKKTKNAKVKKVLLDIAQEEKVHVGEFQALLKILDKEENPSQKEGEKEVKGI